VICPKCSAAYLSFDNGTVSCTGQHDLKLDLRKAQLTPAGLKLRLAETWSVSYMRYCNAACARYQLSEAVRSARFAHRHMPRPALRSRCSYKVGVMPSWL
jgi:hypothetical protein